MLDTSFISWAIRVDLEMRILVRKVLNILSRKLYKLGSELDLRSTQDYKQHKDLLDIQGDTCKIQHHCEHYRQRYVHMDLGYMGLEFLQLVSSLEI